MTGIALGKIGDPKGFNAVTRLLEEDDGRDPYIRHAGVMAWSGMKDINGLVLLAGHESVPVRLAAVVALRRLKDGSVREFLTDPNPFVIREAARAIHDDFSIPNALPDLATELTQFPVAMQSDEAIVRRSISANMRLGHDEHAQRLMDFAEIESAPSDMRLEALESLATWNADPFLDRVVGRVRVLSNRQPRAAEEVLSLRFQKLLDRANGTFRSDLIQLAAKYGITVNDSILAEWVVSESIESTTRVRALSSMTQSDYPGLSKLILKVIQGKDSNLRNQAMRSLAMVDGDLFVELFRNTLSELSISEQQLGLRLLGDIPHDNSASILGGYVAKWKEGSLQPGLHLDVISAVSKQGNPELNKWLAAYRRKLGNPTDIRYHQSSLLGGNADRGHEVFTNHVTGQCVRCHDAGGADKQVGPVLKGIGKLKSREYLLESLINPAAQLAEGYALTMITLKNGETQAGRVTLETTTDIFFINVAGESFQYPKSELANRTEVQASSMPPMMGILTPFELRDLVEYLATWE